MKLEFFEDGSEGKPLLLLHGGEHGEIARLREALGPLTESVKRRLAIHELPFVRAEHCTLIAFSGSRSVGVAEGPITGSFTWVLDPPTWRQVSGLLEPFERVETAAGTRFQYLSGTDRGPEVIYSTAREW